ncbi:MAG TPA: hypothetical protein VEN31_04675 [Candidatus Bathyarchaeia archaeon]|nr:hypothetical protein [Candidatus Bathyarchaeia archaeon]
MIWFTLREHRAQLVAMSITAAFLAIGLAVMGTYAAAQRAALGVDTCVPLPNTNANCVDLTVEWQRRIGLAPYLIWALLLAPALAASYIGGPLFGATFERGTHRLALTQAISRVRWSATRIGVLLAITAVCGVVLAQFGWAAVALNGLSGGVRDAFSVFDVDGPPVVGYGLFGIAVGGLIGAFSRRALRGMFVGLLLFAGARVVVAAELRPNYEPPLVAYGNTMSSAVTLPPRSWVLSSATVDAEDRPIDFREEDKLMQGFSASARAGGPTDMGTYLANLGVRQRYVYQPAERYAKFQWIEFGVFSGLAAGCALLTIALIRRRDA